MFTKELEEIIEAALADGVLTDKERAVLHKRALAEGVDPDELDVVIEGRLAKMKKSEDWLRPTPPPQMANEKLGNIVKCPSCGAPVVGGSAVCPECGYTFSNVKANSSVEKLLEKLEDFNRRQEARADNRSIVGGIAHSFAKVYGMDNTSKYKMDIISTFPVPNTRADLLEFLTMIQSRANSTGPKDGLNLSKEEDLSYAYWLLYTNCINKAKLSFANDSDFTPYFEHYAQELNKGKGFFGYFRRNPHTRYALIALICVILFFVLLGTLFYLAN